MSSSLKFFLCWLSQLVTKRTHPKHKTSNSYLFILSEANPVNPLQKEEEEEERRRRSTHPVKTRGQHKAFTTKTKTKPQFKLIVFIAIKCCRCFF